jgi:hypothetical protein
VTIFKYKNPALIAAHADTHRKRYTESGAFSLSSDCIENFNRGTISIQVEIHGDF